MTDRQRILITGASSQQYSQRAALRGESFADALRKIAEDAKYDVTVCQPSFDWTPESSSQFEHVFVGISAPLSLSSNCAYGSLSAVDTLWSSGNLVLFLDAPEPWKIFANLRAINANSSTLFKQFYSRRHGYQRAMTDNAVADSIMRGVDKLLNHDWPMTVIPALPWSSDDVPGVPKNAKSSIRKFYVDSYLVQDSNYEQTRESAWIVDSYNKKWTDGVTSSLMLHWTTPRELKITSGESARKAMSTRIGTIIGPHGDKTTWWSPRYSQSLSANTPVVTDWRTSMHIGDSWTYLASSIESMTAKSRLDLAYAQKQEYMNQVWKKSEAIESLRSLKTGV